MTTSLGNWGMRAELAVLGALDLHDDPRRRSRRGARPSRGRAPRCRRSSRPTHARPRASRRGAYGMNSVGQPVSRPDHTRPCSRGTARHRTRGRSPGRPRRSAPRLALDVLRGQLDVLDVGVEVRPDVPLVDVVARLEVLRAERARHADLGLALREHVRQPPGDGLHRVGVDLAREREALGEVAAVGDRDVEDHRLVDELARAP